MVQLWVTIPIILMIGILVISISGSAFHVRKKTEEKYEKDGKYGYGWPYEFPPLNYFESAESPVLSFWYDPVISSDNGPQTTWGMSQDLPPSNATNLDEVFGPDSYVRYNIEDIDVSQPE